MNCAYCEKPLVCEGCQAEYMPPTPEDYERVSEGEEAVDCPACGEILICHWCKTPYDGVEDAEDVDGGA